MRFASKIQFLFGVLIQLEHAATTLQTFHFPANSRSGDLRIDADKIPFFQFHRTDFRFVPLTVGIHLTVSLVSLKPPTDCIDIDLDLRTIILERYEPIPFSCNHWKFHCGIVRSLNEPNSVVLSTEDNFYSETSKTELKSVNE